MDEKEKMTPKKQSVIRTWFQAAWFVLTNSYIRGFTKGMIFAGNTKVICFPGLNCYSCPGALAACPMGALQAVMGNSSYRVSLYVFGFLGAIGALFGRLVCGWMCPFGLFQDLLHKIPITKKIKNLPGHKFLKYLRYVILVIFPLLLVSIVKDLTGTSDPWFCEWICPSGMLLGGIPLVTLNAGLREAAAGRFIWKLAVLIVISLMSIKVYRPFCKYLCPLGAIYGFFNPISSYRLVIDKEKCVSCGMCQKACGMDIKTFENPNSMDCIRCGSCIASCPKGAISSTWGQKIDKVKSRCFVDEDEGALNLTELPKEISKKATFFGAIAIISGICGVCATYLFALRSAFISKLTIEIYKDYLPTYFILDGLLVVAAALLLIVGIYAIAKKEDAKALLTLPEKSISIVIVLAIGYLIAFVGCIIDSRTYGQIMIPTTYDAAFLLTSVVAVPLSIALKNTILGKENKKLWRLLSVLYVLSLLGTALAFWLLTVLPQ